MAEVEPTPHAAELSGEANHAAKRASAHPRIWQSSELLGGDREAWIEHAGELYRLRLTKAGKLYLTK